MLWAFFHKAQLAAKAAGNDHVQFTKDIWDLLSTDSKKYLRSWRMKEGIVGQG